jgi:predicted enzyme related to lactoylglutathione lyase
MTLRLDHAAPVLAAWRYDASLAFFRRLGFDVVEYDGYAVMRHGGADIHLQSAKRRSQSENSVCYLYVDNVEVFHSIALRAGGRSLEPPTEHPRGGKECAILDPSGILLRVAVRQKRHR